MRAGPRSAVRQSARVSWNAPSMAPGLQKHPVRIEIPAAAYTADLLAPEVDFFTIGTNDLIQYCLAVDRADERVSKLYEPLHPAHLRLIQRICQAGRRAGIAVGMCGEMAGDPTNCWLLVALGVGELSMAPFSIRRAT